VYGAVVRLLILVIGTMGLVVVTVKSIWAASPILESPALSQLIKEGLANNRELQSLKANVESLKEEIPIASSLDDPRIGIAILNLPTNTFDFDQEPMTQKQLFIAQKVPWFGKLNLKKKSKTLMANGQQAILEARRLELARKIAILYYELGFVACSLEINERLTDMVNQLIKVAEVRYSSGKGLQQDVLQAQVELSKLLDEKIILEKNHPILEDRINALLNRENFTHVAPPGDLPFPELRLNLKTLQAISLKHNPWLRVKTFDTDQAFVQVELARKDYWPDMDFKVAYGQRDDDKNGMDWADFVSTSVVFNIPLWQKNRQDKRLSAKQKKREAAIKSYENMKRSLPYRVDALFNEIQNIAESYRLFTTTLLPQAKQWSFSSRSAYSVGKVAFDTMINARIRMLRLELKAKRYLFTIYQRHAELEEIIGGLIKQDGQP